MHADILNNKLQLVKEMFIVEADQTNTKTAVLRVNGVKYTVAKKDMFTTLFPFGYFPKKNMLNS
jgi:hypothetical protein